MGYSKRGNFRRGSRGGSRGFRPKTQRVPEFGNFGMPAPPVRTVYDYTLDKSSLPGTKNTTDAVFDKEIMDRAANLTPPIEIRTKINNYARKVVNALEKEKTEKTLADIGIVQIMHVGSFVTDTTTHSTDKSDVVVQLDILPSPETVAYLGRKIAENMKLADSKETGEPLPTEYGCLITSHSCQVRILITIIATESSKLEPQLHLDEKPMMLSYFAIRHTQWYMEMVKAMPAEFIQEYQALVRVLKDTRSRFSNLQPLSIWALQYLAYYCLVNGPNRQKVSLGTAFRRFFEVISAGIFLPKAPGILDPINSFRHIGFDMTLQERDLVCLGAQTLVRIFATGNDGYRAILGTHGTAADLTQTASTWNGVEIRPSVEAYQEGIFSRFPVAVNKIPVI